MCIVRLLPDCIQSGIPQKIFIKVSNVKFHGTLINASRADTYILSDGRTDIIKLIGERTYKLYKVRPKIINTSCFKSVLCLTSSGRHRNYVVLCFM